MIVRLVPFLCLVQFSLNEDDKKWVWEKGNDERSASSRYQVVEDGFEYAPGHQEEFGFPDRPYPIRPGGFGGHRPHASHPGILTGPVPSWEREPPFKHYDRCKCAEKFNCNSPGISYGQCDVGKQYCCYNSKGNGVLGGPLPSRPHHSPENGVLVGPHHHHHNDGILVGPGGSTGIVGPSGPTGIVGPGGPTGIVGRPPYRPFDRPSLVGPLNEPFFGPEDYSFGGGAYGRRSDPKKTKDLK